MGLHQTYGKESNRVAFSHVGVLIAEIPLQFFSEIAPKTVPGNGNSWKNDGLLLLFPPIFHEIPDGDSDGGGYYQNPKLLCGFADLNRSVDVHADK